ncbi:hypothetical protein GF374_00350 [Candidatus Woesearchaeota archaeon]|nr:hypothetical protein [Candidatus Woesearchaeota archaeon]
MLEYDFYQIYPAPENIEKIREYSKFYVVHNSTVYLISTQEKAEDLHKQLEYWDVNKVPASKIDKLLATIPGLEDKFKELKIKWKFSEVTGKKVGWFKKVSKS